jgi:hypothetical protein
MEQILIYETEDKTKATAAERQCYDPFRRRPLSFLVVEVRFSDYGGQAGWRWSLVGRFRRPWLNDPTNP